MIIPVSAAETTATITFDDPSKAQWSTEQQLWQENGITVTNNKAASTNNIDVTKKYSNPARFYKSSEVIVEYPSMTKLVIDHTGQASKYVGWKDSFSDTNATAVADANTTTITFATPVDSFKFNSMSVQSRAFSITVYANAGAGEDDVCAHEETTIVSNGDETHSFVCNSCEEIVVTAQCQDTDLNCVCDTCEGEVALPETLTIAEAIALGAEQATSAYTEDKYFVTGQITSIEDEDWGNMYIADKEGNSILIYDTYSADGKDRYDALETKPVVGDTIKVLSVVGNYKDTPQLKNAWIIEIIEEEEIFEGTDPEAPIELAVNESVPATLKEIKVPAASTVFVKVADANGIFHVTSTTGACLLINGRSNQVEISDAYDLTLCGYEMVNIYNSGEETITLYVFLEAGAGEVFGTWDNPEVLELQENQWMPNFPPSAEAQTELEAGNQGYFYTITAEKDGTFAFSITANDAEYNDVGYQFSVTNNTTSWQSDLIARAAGADDYYDSVEVSVSAGDEILINAGTYNPEDSWNAPAGTINVRVGFSAPPAVGSQECPEVIETTGEYAATVEAGSQGYYYEWIVEADGTVTVTMNDEAGWQYFISKVPVDVDDYANYYNSDTHWYNDDPVVATETVDVKAGETVKVWVNTFDPANEWNPPAGTVNWTLSFTEKVSNPGVFSMADTEAYAGKEFTVAIDISNNPGIISAVLDIVYDKDVLELVKAEAGEFNNKTTSLEEEVDCYFFSEDYSRINWVDALAAENCVTNGTFAVLTFKVKEGATGETSISINFDADNVFNKDLENVEFTATGATITIKEGMPGDVNGDGSVDNKDYALLMQYLNGWDVELDLGVADVNGDGSVDNKDYALLMQFLNGWDVELK